MSKNFSSIHAGEVIVHFDVIRQTKLEKSTNCKLRLNTFWYAYLFRDVVVVNNCTLHFHDCITFEALNNVSLF